MKDGAQETEQLIWLQQKMLPGAKIVRFLLQVVIAVGLVTVVCLKLLHQLSWLSATWMQPIYAFHTLQIVAAALSYAAAIELAYMLLTPGPDEAIDPLILALAATILLHIEASRPKFEASGHVGNGLADASQLSDAYLANAGLIAIYVLILAGLFVIRQVFVHERWFRRRPTIVTPDQ